MEEFSEPDNTKEWTLASSKNYTVKPNKNHKCESTSPDQLIMATNQFNPLSNLQANNADSSGLQEQKKADLNTRYEQNNETTQNRYENNNNSRWKTNAQR